MADRYFVASPVDGARAVLAGAEAHHLAHVMRAAAGDEIVVFDGSGSEYRARVERIDRAQIELAILSQAVVDREAAARITLGVALPKGERQRWLVEKAVELGVERLVPLATERGLARESVAAVERLRRAVVEASKQCGRNRLMEIGAPEGLGDYVRANAGAALRLIAEPGAAGIAGVVEAFSRGCGERPVAALAIGPEGGFTATEVDAARAAGWQAVGLGKRILRVETAALALAAAVITPFE